MTVGERTEMYRGRRERGIPAEPLEQRILLAGATRLLSDVNEGNAGSPFKLATAYGNEVAFVGIGGLLASDGTESGTRVLASGFGVEAVGPAIGDKLLFVGRNESSSFRLWSTNGIEINEVSPRVKYGTTPFPVFDNRIAFVADDLEGRDQVYLTDGSSSGTSQVTDFSGDRSAGLLVTTENQLFFFRKAQLWVSDGTTTRRISGPLEIPTHLIPVGDRLFFQTDSEIGRALWVSDGTVGGTRPFHELKQSPESRAELDGKLIFTSASSELGREVWSSDGTEEGTVLLKSFDQIDNRSVRPPENLVRVGNELLFSTGGELWRTDGTSEGTRLFEQIEESIESIVSTGTSAFVVAENANRQNVLYFLGPDGLSKVFQATLPNTNLEPVVVGQRVYFSGATNLGEELWVSDGTEQGTYQVLDQNTNGRGSDPRMLVSVGDYAVLEAEDGISSRQLWVTDGRALAPLDQIEDPMGAAEYYSIRADFFLRVPNSGGTLAYANLDQLIGWEPDIRFAGITKVGLDYFFLHESDEKQELWRTDLTPAGTTLVQRFSSGFVRQLGELNGELIFFTGVSSHGSIVRMSDGTPEGTRRVRDVRGDGHTLLVEDGYAFFSRWFRGRAEIYRSDGTEEGTTRLADFDRVNSMQYAGGKLFVSAKLDGEDNLWAIEFADSQPTVTNTGLVTDLSDIVPFGDVVCLRNGLRCTDGTPEGTELILPEYAYDLTVVGDMLVWPRDVPAFGTELWASDGTAAGLRRLTDIEQGPRDSYPTEPALVGDNVVFFAQNTNFGREPWVIESRDYGDAPAPYQSSSVDGGASHKRSGLYLGTEVTTELDARIGVTDTADDGVRLPSRLLAGETATVGVTASEVGFLDAWIDFNRNGKWDEEEQIFSSFEVPAGESLLQFSVPEGAPYQETTFARFRISDTGGLAPIGEAGAGEVEDYDVSVLGTGVWRVGNDIRVLGTSGADKVTATEEGDELEITLGGNRMRFPSSEVRRIRIETGAGSDRIAVSANVSALIESGPGNDAIVGGSGSDTIRAGSGNDHIVAKGGNDLIHSGAGHDHIASGDGNDTILAASGRDFVHGGPDNDLLDAGHDHDIVLGANGDDTLLGSAGFDFLVGGRGRDLLEGAEGQDILLPGGTTHGKSDLLAIQAEWLPRGGYLQKVSRIRGEDAGLTSLLTMTTVLDDADTDTLFGNTARDWFFASGADLLGDRKSSEAFDQL